MTERCPACRGDMVIRIPLYHELEVLPTHAPKIRETSRLVACPLCGVPDRAEVLKVEKSVPEGLPAEVVASSLSRQISEYMLKKGFVKFETIPHSDPEYPRRPWELIRATVIVLHPDKAIPLEAKIQEKQRETARDVAQRIASEVGNWGSYFGDQTINKSQVYSLIGDVLRAVGASNGR